jgi:hypothetical protein
MFLLIATYGLRNTGARVQEIADLRASDLQLTKLFPVRLFGKGIELSGSWIIVGAQRAIIRVSALPWGRDASSSVPAKKQRAVRPRRSPMRQTRLVRRYCRSGLPSN